MIASQQMLLYFSRRSGKHCRSAADREKVGNVIHKHRRSISLPLRLFSFLSLLRMILLILPIRLPLDPFQIDTQLSCAHQSHVFCL